MGNLQVPFLIKYRSVFMSARRERVVFDNVYKKLERELLEKKKQMANIIELSNLSYEQRDNFQVGSSRRFRSRSSTEGACAS